MQLLTCLCGSREFSTVFTYDNPPSGEVRFDFGSAPYAREIRRCANCGHFLSVHDIDMQALYSGQYVDATYGGNGLKRAFDRITDTYFELVLDRMSELVIDRALTGKASGPWPRWEEMVAARTGDARERGGVSGFIGTPAGD